MNDEWSWRFALLEVEVWQAVMSSRVEYNLGTGDESGAVKSLTALTYIYTHECHPNTRNFLYQVHSRHNE